MLNTEMSALTKHLHFPVVSQVWVLLGDDGSASCWSKSPSLLLRDIKRRKHASLTTPQIRFCDTNCSPCGWWVGLITTFLESLGSGTPSLNNKWFSVSDLFSCVFCQQSVSKVSNSQFVTNINANYYKSKKWYLQF